MRKTLLFIMLAGICLSCTKNVAVPNNETESNIFFRDANIEISNFTASQSGSSGVSFNFNIQASDNVSKMELMCGENTNVFCTVYHIPIQANNSIQFFSFTDTQPKGNPAFYIVRYTLKDGTFGGFSPVYTFYVK